MRHIESSEMPTQIHKDSLVPICKFSSLLRAENDGRAPGVRQGPFPLVLPGEVSSAPKQPTPVVIQWQLQGWPIVRCSCAHGAQGQGTVVRRCTQQLLSGDHFSWSAECGPSGQCGAQRVCSRYSSVLGWLGPVQKQGSKQPHLFLCCFFFSCSTYIQQFL